MSLAEIEKVVRELYPAFDNKPALLRAYKAADRTGDGFITRKEFRLLLQGLRYFHGVWARFASLDADGDRKSGFIANAGISFVPRLHPGSVVFTQTAVACVHQVGFRCKSSRVVALC